MILTMQPFPTSWLQPDWPAPAQVHAVMTTREGGISSAPWDRMNLGDHVGDRPENVQANRSRLAQVLQAQPVFLQQVHGTQVLRLNAETPDGLQADACWTTQTDVACAIMVADCLPVLMCDGSGQWVAAAHAGWRGLAGVNGRGVLEALLAELPLPEGRCTDVRVWLGPCIGPQAFEVGSDVKTAFDDGSPELEAFFVPSAPGKFMADLAGLARWRLRRLGVSAIHGNDSQAQWCTASQAPIYFSHRRDSRAVGQSGRMAACIWLGR